MPKLCSSSTSTLMAMKVVNQLATCSIQDEITQVKLCHIFAEKLKKNAMMKQDKKGSKGRYRSVEFETEDL
jgi:hypothetical protein